MSTHMTNISVKFHQTPTTKYEDIASREIGVNGQRQARRHTRKHNACRPLLLTVEAHEQKNQEVREEVSQAVQG